MNYPSNDFIHRIIKFYELQNLNVEMTSIWGSLINNFKELHNNLINKDIIQTKKILDEIYINPTLWGIDWFKTHEMISEYPQITEKALFNLINDLKIQTPNSITEETILEIESKTQFSLDFPLFPNRPIISLFNRNIPARYVTCIQAVHHLKNHIKNKPNEILEIGAGTGYITYLLTKMYPNIKYNIIDLPLVSIVHAYLYSTIFGEDKIWFVGEEKNKSNKNLFFYSPNSYQDLLNYKIDLAINHNSFPEIPRTTQQKYLELFEQIFNKEAFLFSINWEPTGEQYPIANACDDHGKFKRIYRDNFKGDCEWHYKLSNYYPYFEEVFILESNQ